MLAIRTNLRDAPTHQAYNAVCSESGVHAPTSLGTLGSVVRARGHAIDNRVVRIDE